MKFSKFGMSGKFFSEAKGARIGMVSFARETKAPSKMTATWENRCRGKGGEEGRLDHEGDLTGSRVCREGRDCCWLGYIWKP